MHSVVTAGEGVWLTPHKLGSDGKSEPQPAERIKAYLVRLAADTVARNKITDTLGPAAKLGGCGILCQYQVYIHPQLA